MPNAPLPPLDPLAAHRWQHAPLSLSPWLHEEVGRRMAERLQWLREPPKSWWNWQALNGGLTAHQTVQGILPTSRVYLHETTPVRQQHLQRVMHKGATGLLRRWRQAFTETMGLSGGQAGIPDIFSEPPAGSVDMVWANMALHTATHPQVMLQRWRDALKVDGIVMFSCLGPDSLLELRQLYQNLGWAPPCQAFTDMHDWGDMAIEAGFSEPVMDVERITLAYNDLGPLLRDLREWGRNLHPSRRQSVAPQAWRLALQTAFTQARTSHTGQLNPFNLSFEVIYGHAIKPPPRVAVANTSQISLDDMRTLLRQGKNS